MMFASVIRSKVENDEQFLAGFGIQLISADDIRMATCLDRTDLPSNAGLFPSPSAPRLEQIRKKRYGSLSSHRWKPATSFLLTPVSAHCGQR